MKTIQTLIGLASGLLLGFILLNTSCTRDDAIVGTIDPPDYEYGDATVKVSEGWNFDKAHSNVMWETPYKGVGSSLTGRFNTFSAIVEFDEDNPESSSFSGLVVLSTVNTGEPGRDAGCLLNTFGVSVSDTARLTSKLIQFDGKGGYDTTVEFEFHGVKKEIPMKLTFSKPTYIDGSAPYYLAGFSAEFAFNALTDFLISSSNIADVVTVRINTAFKKPV